MFERRLIQQLDEGIDGLRAQKAGDLAYSDPEVAELLDLATKLIALPRPGFQAELRSELFRATPATTQSGGLAVSLASLAGFTDRRQSANAVSKIVPVIALPGNNLYPVQRSSFLTSLAAHALVFALLITSGIWAAPAFQEKPRVSSVLVTDLSSYPLPAAPGRAGGGGGGGDSDPLQASKGNPPRFDHEQITPPAIVVRNEQPKLIAEPAVVGPPALSFPQNSAMGDPFSPSSGPQSNGTGTDGGLGSGKHGGVGPGAGLGIGGGGGGGIGNGAYLAGGGVSAPRPIYDPEPDYSEEARKAKYQGAVLLQIVVGADGLPRDLRIARSLGMGLDEKALEAVRRWRFDPGTLGGHPVAVVVNVEVNFRLY